MKNNVILALVIFISFQSVFSQNLTEDNKNLPILKGKYLGQKPPGDTPKIFAPGIISTIYHEHSAPNFSPDGKLVIYTLSCEQGHIIMYMELKNGKWSMPKPLPFSGKYSDDSHVWSNDGSKLYFLSKRPMKNDTIDNVYRNWVVKKNSASWAEPVPNNFTAYSFSNSGRNYFHFENKETGWDICQSDSKTLYQEYKKLNENINSKNVDATPFIAEDESYLIFSSMGREDAIGIMDLYISFKKDDGSWTKAKNMGEPINLPGHISRFPRVSPDGKYLFYWCNIKKDKNITESLSTVENSLKVYKPKRPKNGRDGDIYWIDAIIIKELKQRESGDL